MSDSSDLRNNEIATKSISEKPVDSTPSTSYRINANGIIEEIGGDWEYFAQENQGRELKVDQVLGNSLWTYIKDKGTKRLYEMLLNRIRKTGEMLKFPYRCDSPNKRRYMQMELQLNSDGGFEFNNFVLREEERDPNQFFKQRFYSPIAMVIVCSFCNKVRRKKAQGWVEVDEMAREEKILDHENPLRIAYGVCQDCQQRVNVLAK